MRENELTVIVRKATVQSALYLLRGHHFGIWKWNKKKMSLLACHFSQKIVLLVILLLALFIYSFSYSVFYLGLTSRGQFFYCGHRWRNVSKVGMGRMWSDVFLVWPVIIIWQNVGVARTTLVWRRPHQPFYVLHPWLRQRLFTYFDVWIRMEVEGQLQTTSGRTLNRRVLWSFCIHMLNST